MESSAKQERQQATFPMKGYTYHPLPLGREHGRVISHAVQTIKATPEQVFNVFSRPELLPSWQEGVVSVTATGETTYHWVMQDPGTGKHIEFDAEVLEVVPNRKHMAQVLNGPFESSTDTYTFDEAPAGRGTLVTAISDYKLPGGIVANTLGKLFTRSPEQLTIENLRHLKQLIESSEIPSVEGQPAGPRGVIGRWKQLLMGENLPVPPGTSYQASHWDFAEENTHEAVPSALLMGSVVAAAALAAWFVIQTLRSTNPDTRHEGVAK